MAANNVIAREKKSIIDLIIQSNTKSSMPLRARRRGRIEIAIAACCRRRRDPFDQFLLFFCLACSQRKVNGCVVISNII